MRKSIHHNVICIIALLAFFVVNVGAIREEKKEKGKTIVQSNHFESTTTKSANYNIDNIKIGKPLILLLKKDQKKTNLVSDFQISLKSKSIKVNCDFKKITDLCIIENTQEDKVNMIIQCKVLPCKVSWVIYQPQIKSPSPNQIALNLFTLNESSRHLIGQITCNDPSIDSLDRDVTIYSESPYRRIYKDNILYVLFNNEKKGYVFVDIDKKTAACSQISFKQAPLTLTTSLNITNDFVLKQSSAIYQLDSIPKGDFRFQCNSIRLDSIKQLKSSMSVTLFGLQGTSRKQIAKHDLMVSTKRANEFTIAFKKIEDQYEKLQIRFQVSTNQIILLQSRLVIEDVQLLQLGQSLFFNLKKQGKINVKLLGNDAAEVNQTIYVIPKRSDEITLSNTSCSAKLDCQFTITATADTQNMILISSFLTNSTSIDDQGKGLYQFQQIQFIPINKSQQHKITIGDHIFFKKPLKKHQNIQVHINTPNALMYAACQSQCQVPDQRCRQRTGNFHHPFIFEAKQDCNFLINVQGLENTLFQLTIIQNEQFIELQDGTPFSYTMDSKQERVDFKIKLAEKADVSFNLISPLNSLRLLVANSKNSLPDEDTSQQSTDGYILIQKGQIKGLQFVISVIKLKDFQSFFTHFSLVVSTKHQKLRLEPAVTNYETLMAQTYRDFIFEFDPSENYILSFYAHNLKDRKIQLQVQVSDEQKKWDKAQVMTIQQEADYFDLDQISDTLCEEEGVLSCQIFLRITNKMDIEVDFTIILLMKNAIVELKDGIWQAFPQTYLTSSTNFYFYPRHQNQNIFISYNIGVSHVRLTYRLWKYDQEEINPSQWPFPKIIQDKEQTNNQFKVHNYVLIDHQQMKQRCWPNCVLLVSLYLDYQALAKQNNNHIVFEQTYFQIMVSNNHAELPEKQKMSLTLGKDENKRIIVDLKYVINKQTLTFFTATTIGQCPIYATAYSQENPTCPANEESSDFIITPGEDVLALQSIKEKLKNRGAPDDRNVYLCLNVHSATSCKISIQYSSESQGFKKIHSDSFEDIQLNINQTKYYQIDTLTKQYAKITRISGFSFVLIKKCQMGQHKKCMQDFKSDPEKGKQIVVKTQSFEQDFCNECIVLFKFSTVQPSRINFHLQSGYYDLQLKENNILSDFANEGEINKYLINANAKEDLIVNIHIQEGEVEVKVTNLKNINLNKKSDSKNRILHFVIKSSNDTQIESSSALTNPLALSSDIMIYHITIQSVDPTKATSYTISYSSGKREIYLQDGVIFDYILETNKVSTFYYFNLITSNHVFYSLSMANATTLNQLKIKSYYLQDPNDVTSKTEITLQKPNIAKKTANPTILFSLPEHNYFMFQLTNPSKQEKISMAINHQQVILLPFDHEFPFQLHKKQEINILVDVNIPGYLDVSIRKCDRTQPNFAYSFDYDGFIKGQFMYQAILNEQANSHFTIKANRIGTLYINFKANVQEDSTISLKVSHTQQKSKVSKFKAGKRGILTYELVGQKNARVTIPAADCDQSQCKGVNYYYLSSTDEQQVYTQLICSSSFFSTAGFNSSTPLPLSKIQAKEVNKTVTFDFKMEASTVFLGVKAVSSSGEQVYYQPTEVASLWGKWMQSSLLQRCLMVFLVFLCLCVTIVFVRRASRKGYRPLDQS